MRPSASTADHFKSGSASAATSGSTARGSFNLPSASAAAIRIHKSESRNRLIVAECAESVQRALAHKWRERLGELNVLPDDHLRLPEADEDFHDRAARRW